MVPEFNSIGQAVEI